MADKVEHHWEETNLRRTKWKPFKEKKKKKKSHNNVTKEVREYVLNRDEHRCVKCASEEELHIHHKEKKSEGGSGEPSNLITLCRECHAEEHKGENVYNILKKK